MGSNALRQRHNTVGSNGLRQNQELQKEEARQKRHSDWLQKKTSAPPMLWGREAMRKTLASSGISRRSNDGGIRGRSNDGGISGRNNDDTASDEFIGCEPVRAPVRRSARLSKGSRRRGRVAPVKKMGKDEAEKVVLEYPLKPYLQNKKWVLRFDSLCNTYIFCIFLG